MLTLTRLHKWSGFLHKRLCLFEGWLCWSGSWRLWPFLISFEHGFRWLSNSWWPLLGLSDYPFLSLWRCKLTSNWCSFIKVATIGLTSGHCCCSSGGPLLHFRRDWQAQFFMFQLFIRHYRCHVSRVGLECSNRSDNVSKLFRCLSSVAITCSIYRQRGLACRCLGWLTNFIRRFWYDNFSAIFNDWFG